MSPAGGQKVSYSELQVEKKSWCLAGVRTIIIMSASYQALTRLLPGSYQATLVNSVIVTELMQPNTRAGRIDMSNLQLV